MAGTPTRTDRLVGPSAPTVETVGMPGVPWHAGHQGADLQTRRLLIQPGTMTSVISASPNTRYASRTLPLQT